MSALQLSEQEFLCGATGPITAAWNTMHFDRYIGDIDCTPDPHEALMSVPGHPDYVLVPSSQGDSMLLLHQVDERIHVAGYYNPPGAVCLHPDHQGKGLGRELILATALWLGGPPTQGLDEQCFTVAGWHAHRAAWRLGIERGLIGVPAARVAARLQL